MKKNKKKIRSPKSSRQKKVATNSFISKLYIFKHLLFFFTLIYLCFALTKKDKSYHWFYNNLLKKNLEYAFGKHGDFDLEKKYITKLQFTYIYLDYLKKQTPEDAIILMPDKEIFLQKDAKQKFQYHIVKKGYASFFLYPRKVIYEVEKDTSPLYNLATHVAIVNKWGYDKLKYKTTNQVDYTVLPIEYIRNK